MMPPTDAPPSMSKSQLKQHLRMQRRMEKLAPKRFQQFMASGERTRDLMHQCINDSPFWFRVKFAVATILGRLPDGR